MHVVENCKTHGSGFLYNSEKLMVCVCGRGGHWDGETQIITCRRLIFRFSPLSLNGKVLEEIKSFSSDLSTRLVYIGLRCLKHQTSVMRQKDYMS